MEHMKTTLHSLEFMRLEACPKWVSIALERLEDRPEDEVTLAELERLAIGLRLVGCACFAGSRLRSWADVVPVEGVYGRAVVRLRELEAGMVVIREQQFSESTSR